MKRRRKARGTVFMICALIVGCLLFLTGLVLRRTVLAGNVEFAEMPAISIPLMLIQDMSPVYEALENTPAEEDIQDTALFSAPEPTEEIAPATVEPTAEPTVTEEPTEEPTASPPETPEETLVPWVLAGENANPFADLAPEWEPDESYFDHTLFVGDSRTDGMRMWARLGEAEYFCGTSYTIFNILKKEASDTNFSSMKLRQLLKKHEYNQIYILLGYNEAGYSYSVLMDQFKEVILTIHKAQPDARIILYGVMQPSRKISTSGPDFSLQKISQINDGLKELADQADGLYYVPCTTAFYDEDGYMRSEVTTDGEHLKPDYVREWAQEIVKAAIAP